MIEELELSDVTIPTAAPYDFITHFNRVQSTVLLNGLPTEDCNLVLGTATGTGKTITAELFVHAVLAEGRKVVYVAPMKALVREKYEEWDAHFADKEVSILTGDYRPTAATRRSLRDADIIVVTSEMLDSQTRSAIRSDDHWLSDIGLIIMDEAHIIGSGSRGPAAEAGITRICAVDRENPPRVLLLSATLPNAKDFSNWLVKLNNKKTYSLISSWRPVPLKWEFYPGTQKWYGAIRNEMVTNAVKLVKKKSTEKFLIFCHEKKTGQNLLTALKKAGIKTEFHRADLSMSKRVELENKFKDENSDLRVLPSTSTLAWGCNLPARNVIIMGTQRGTSPLDMADIIQMSGRAGRAGFDDMGYCHLFCPDRNTSIWAKKVTQVPEVKSAMLDEAHLRFQIMAEVDLGILKTLEDLPKWFEQTLVGQQVDYPDDHFKKAVRKLVEMDMLLLKDNKLHITEIGKVGTKMYFTPDDIHYWVTFMKENKVIDSDSKIAGLIAGAPTIALDYVPAEFKSTVGHFAKACREEKTKHQLKCLFTPFALWEHLRGNANDQYALKFHLQGILYDIERIDSVLTSLASLTGTALPTDLRIRIQHGVPKQLSFLCNIPNIGPKKAWLLYTAGVTDPVKLKETELSTLVTCLGALTAKKVYAAIHG